MPLTNYSMPSLTPRAKEKYSSLKSLAILAYSLKEYSFFACSKPYTSDGLLYSSERHLVHRQSFVGGCSQGGSKQNVW